MRPTDKSFHHSHLRQKRGFRFSHVGHPWPEGRGVATTDLWGAEFGIPAGTAQAPNAPRFRPKARGASPSGTRRRQDASSGAVRRERSAETMEGKARRFYSLSHFHTEDGEYQVSVDIVSGVVEGRSPGPALNAVLEWYRFTEQFSGGLRSGRTMQTCHPNISTSE